MSNAAVVSSLSQEIAAVSAGLARVAPRASTPWAQRSIDGARGCLAEAQMQLAIALNAGVDPVIEVAAA